MERERESKERARENYLPAWIYTADLQLLFAQSCSTMTILDAGNFLLESSCWIAHRGALYRAAPHVRDAHTLQIGRYVGECGVRMLLSARALPTVNILASWVFAERRVVIWRETNYTAKLIRQA